MNRAQCPFGVSDSNASLAWGNHTRENLEKCALTGAVLTNNGQHLTSANRKLNARQRPYARIASAKVSAAQKFLVWVRHLGAAASFLGACIALTQAPSHRRHARLTALRCLLCPP